MPKIELSRKRKRGAEKNRKYKRKRSKSTTVIQAEDGSEDRANVKEKEDDRMSVSILVPPCDHKVLTLTSVPATPTFCGSVCFMGAPTGISKVYCLMVFRPLVSGHILGF